MKKTDDIDFTKVTNEGEGSKTAARSYNDEAEQFARSGDVDPAAREARDSFDREGTQLREAELEGKSHVAEEDRLLHDKG